ERPEDIPLLARHFLKKHAVSVGRTEMEFTHAAIDMLKAHNWPGNARELEHIVQRAVVFCEGDRVDITHLTLRVPDRPTFQESFQQAKARIVAEFERNYIRRLLKDCDGNISRAARAAKKNRRGFWELMRKYQISVR